MKSIPLQQVVRVPRLVGCFGTHLIGVLGFLIEYLGYDTSHHPRTPNSASIRAHLNESKDTRPSRLEHPTTCVLVPQPLYMYVQQINVLSVRRHFG